MEIDLLQLILDSRFLIENEIDKMLEGDRSEGALDTRFFEFHFKLSEIDKVLKAHFEFIVRGKGSYKNIKLSEGFFSNSFKFLSKYSFQKYTLKFVGTGETISNFAIAISNNCFDQVVLEDCEIGYGRIKFNGSIALINAEYKDFDFNSFTKIRIEGVNTKKHKENSKSILNSDNKNAVIRLYNSRGNFYIQGKNYSGITLRTCNLNHLRLSDFDVKNISIKASSKIESLSLSGIGGRTLVAFQYTELKKLVLHNLDFSAKSGINFEIKDATLFPFELETSEIKWDYNGLIDNDFQEGKRRFFNLLKNHYSSTDDVLNTQLMNAFEKRWYLNNSIGSFPLWASWLSNSFGLSLQRPLKWILFLALLQAALMLTLAGTCEPHLAENWGVLINIINPAHRTSLFLDVLIGKCNPPLSYTNWLYVIDNLNRILIGYLIFQFANAFRYKYKLR